MQYRCYTDVMRILIVDYGTGNLENLLHITSRHEVEVVKPEELEVVDTVQFKSIILIGGYDHDVVSDMEAYATDMELISESKMPVLGVCFGFELVCAAFGVYLSESTDKFPGAGRIMPTGDGARIFQGSDPILVNETTRWGIEELPKSLVKFATSETGIEAIKHKTLPVYGLQLGPGDFKYPSDGKLVYDNILQAFGK
jgi:anthranilate/para-aminobenzoate synthase component II